MHPETQRRIPATSAMLVGALVVVGWAWHEVVLVASTREPFLTVRLLPGWLLAVAIGAAVGLLCRLHRTVYFVLLVGATAASLALSSGRAGGSPVLVPLSMVVVVLLLGGGIASVLVGRQAAVPVTVPILVGALLSLAVHAYRFGFDQRSWPVFLGALILMLGQLGGRRSRLVAGALAILISAALANATGRERSALRRADQTVTRSGDGGSNLVLIVLDTVSARHLAPYGYGRVTTPNLDAFVSRQATVYTEARSASSWTLPSHASLFTGLLPAEHQATHPRRPPGEADDSSRPAYAIPEGIPTLAEILARNGYLTQAVVANSAYLGEDFGMDRGFAHYDDRKSAIIPPWAVLPHLLGWQPELGRKPYRDARTITDLALRLLHDQQAGRPFFLFVNYMDAHSPYYPPRPYDRQFGSPPVDPLNPEKADWSDLYDGELAYLDRHLGRLLQALEEHDSFDDTVLVITADHGEAFDQHGFWGHGAMVYEALIHVPLYLKPAGGRRSATDSTRLSGAQLFHLMRQEIGSAGAVEPDPRAVVAECYRYAPMTRLWPDLDLGRDVMTWFEGPHKVIVNSRGEVEIYDLATDPDETTNLAGETDSLSGLVARAERWWRDNPPREIRSDDEELAPETVERLRALGYVE